MLCRDEMFISIRFGMFRPLAPRRFLQDEIHWRRGSALTLLNYNNIIPKQGRIYPALVFTEENRGVVSCSNPSYPDMFSVLGYIPHGRIHSDKNNHRGQVCSYVSLFVSQGQQQRNQ